MKTNTIKATNQKQIANFWSKVDYIGKSKDECWEWQASTNSKTKVGYGHVWFDGKVNKAHRVAYTIAKGEIPKGKLIRHKCDNPLCCNPHHLEPGTHLDNSRDMFERGRNPNFVGENNNYAKLKDDQVREIKALLKEGKLKQVQIAAQYGVTKYTISRIKMGLTWTHI